MTKGHGKRKSLDKPMLSGFLWFLSQTAINRVATLLSQLLLARILMPEDFGVWGLSLTVSGVFGLLTTLGVEQVLQQRSRKMRYWGTQALIFGGGVSTLAAIAMAIFAPLGADLYGSEEITLLVWILAISLPLKTIAYLPQVNLQSHLRFKFVALYNSFEILSVQGLIILMALWGYGAISFVLPVTLLTFVRAVVFWIVAPLPLLPLKRAKGFRALVAKSLAAWSGTICATLIDHGDYIILGLLASVKMVGAYFFAFKLAFQPIKIFAQNLTNVLYPTVALMDKDIRRQRDATFKTSSFLLLLVAPVAVMQAAVAEPLFLFLFGEKWILAIPYFQILSLGLPFDVFCWPVDTYLSARGLFLLRTRYLSISALCFYLLVGAGALYAEALGAAISVAVYYFFKSLLFSTVVYVKDGIRISALLRAYLLPLLVSAAAIGPGYLFVQHVPALTHPLLQFTLPLVLGGLLYLLLTYIFMREEVVDIWQRGQKFLKKKKQKAA